MPHSSLIHLRAFELRSGPQSARLITVNPHKSIAELYPRICAVLQLSAPLSRVTFHKTRNKQVDTAPLSTATPLDALGLADNDIFIVRLRDRSRSAARLEGGARSVDAGQPTQRVGQLPHRDGVDGGRSIVSEEDSSGPQDAEVASSSAPLRHSSPESATGVEDSTQLAQPPLALPRALTSSVAPAEACAAVGQQQGMRHSGVTHVFFLKLFQLLAALSRTPATPPPSGQQAVSPLPVASVSDVNRELITTCCLRAQLPSSQLAALQEMSAVDADAVFEALGYYLQGDGAPQSAVEEAEVSAWLARHIPPLRRAARVVCLLHVGREAEFLECTLLRLLGRTPTALTWLCLRDAGAPSRRCFYSAIAARSQSLPPMHVDVAEVAVVDVAGMTCSCVQWGLYNAPYNGHLPPVLSCLWARLTAAVMTGEESAAERISDMLAMYSEWEAALT